MSNQTDTISLRELHAFLRRRINHLNAEQARVRTIQRGVEIDTYARVGVALQHFERGKSLDKFASELEGVFTPCLGDYEETDQPQPTPPKEG